MHLAITGSVGAVLKAIDRGDGGDRDGVVVAERFGETDSSSAPQVQSTRRAVTT